MNKLKLNAPFKTKRPNIFSQLFRADFWEDFLFGGFVLGVSFYLMYILIAESNKL